MGKLSLNRHRVKIIKHLPLGLSVELEGGGQGIIRVREISWDFEKRVNWKEYFPVGTKTWAVPVPAESGQFSELSLRLAENDPWEDVSSHFHIGEIYEGIVTGVVGYGSFVELAPGVTGLLHQSRFPAWVQKSPVELFWPGDRVRVVVEKVEEKKRRMGLSLPPEKLFAVEESALQPSTTEKPDSVVDKGQTEIEKFVSDNSNIKRILIVEDDREQARLISNWLSHVVRNVDFVGGAEEALASIKKIPPDIVFIDAELPDMDGFALANQLLERFPRIQLVITTDYASADERIKELDSLLERGAVYLPKPLIPQDILDFLKSIDVQPKASPGLNNIAADSNLFDAGNSVTRSLRMLLQKSRARLEFEAAILFRLDTVRRTVSIVESIAQSQLNSQAIPSLIYSPVRDIAEDGETVFLEKCLKEDEGRFQYLLDLFPMQACIGVPVLLEVPQKYALLFLSSQPKELYEEDLFYAEAVALAAGAYLEQNLFREKSILIQRSALIGQLSRALIHEINNMMGPLSNRLGLLRKKLDGFMKGGASQEKAATLTSKLGEIQEPIKKIVTTMNMLGRITTNDNHEILRLDEIVSETINLLKDMADREHVHLTFVPPEKLLLVRSQPAAFQQILLNLLLNAIQQIAAYRSRHGGVIRVSIEQDIAPHNENLLRILVRDNGPGIHTSLWETIFELGYSTRQDGSGIGLYISRSLAEEKLGGRLFVLKSYILSGSTLALEIPFRI